MLPLGDRSTDFPCVLMSVAARQTTLRSDALTCSDSGRALLRVLNEEEIGLFKGCEDVQQLLGLLEIERHLLAAWGLTRRR